MHSFLLSDFLTTHLEHYYIPADNFMYIVFVIVTTLNFAFFFLQAFTLNQIQLYTTQLKLLRFLGASTHLSLDYLRFFSPILCQNSFKLLYPWLAFIQLGFHQNSSISYFGQMFIDDCLFKMKSVKLCLVFVYLYRSPKKSGCVCLVMVPIF